jgi:hypothetical protein
MQAASLIGRERQSSAAAFIREFGASGAFVTRRLLHDLLSEMPKGARNHLSLAGHITPEGRLEQVARSIALEVEASVVTTRQLSSRLGADCFLHTFSRNNHPHIAAIIEKRSKNGREYRFNREKSDNPCDPSAALLPKLLATHRARAAFTIYTEYVPLPVGAFLEQHGAEHLAEAVFRITQMVPVNGVYKAEPKNRFSPSTLGALLRSVEVDNAINDPKVRASMEKVTALWDRMAATVPDGPLVVSHGDLHLENLRTAETPDGRRILKMLDWEKVGMNYVGADLDFVARGHLSRAAIPKERFLDRYFARAREAFGVSASSVQLAAHLTAAGNSIKRMLETRKLDNLHLAARLMARAQQHLAMPIAWVATMSGLAGF